MEVLKESAYEWAVIPDDLPRKNLVLITAKTPANTYHPNDPKGRKIRIIPVDELHEAGRSLSQRPVGDTHGPIIRGACVIDSHYNTTTKSIEALVFLPDEYIEWVKAQKKLGKRVEWSVEYTFRNSKKLEEGVYEFTGITFNRIDILRNLNVLEKAGDGNTSTSLIDEYFQTNRGLMEMTEVVSEGLETKVVELENKLKETDKVLKEKTEAFEKLSKDFTTVETQKKELEAKIPVLEKDKTDATNIATRLQANVAKFDSEKASAVKEAELRGKRIVIEKVSSVLPESTMVSGLGSAYRAVVKDVKSAIAEVE